MLDLQLFATEHYSMENVKLWKVNLCTDLTKSRLMHDAKNLTSSRSNIAFCYADINCRCKVRYSDGKELFFESISDLEDILDDNENKYFIFAVFIWFFTSQDVINFWFQWIYFWIYSCLQTIEANSFFSIKEILS